MVQLYDVWYVGTTLEYFWYPKLMWLGVFKERRWEYLFTQLSKIKLLYILLERMVKSCEQKSKQINPDVWHLSGCFQSTHVVPTCIYPRGSSTQEFHICPHLWHLQLWQRITFCCSIWYHTIRFWFLFVFLLSLTWAWLKGKRPVIQ